MDFWDFLTKTEWAIIVAGALWILRAPILTMAQRIDLRKLSIAGFDLEFDKRISKAEALVPPQGANDVDKKGDRTHFLKNMQRVFARPPMPESVILESWQKLECEIRLLNKMLTPSSKRTEGRFDILTAAKTVGLSDREILAVTELMKLRDRAAGLENIDLKSDEITRYGDVMDRLLKRLEVLEEEAVDDEIAGNLKTD
jgi:hypothetical protein